MKNYFPAQWTAAEKRRLAEYEKWTVGSLAATLIEYERAARYDAAVIKRQRRERKASTAG